MGDLKIMATSELAVQHEESHWMVKYCNTTGCSVVIRVPRAQAATILNCRWCQAQSDYNTDTSQIHPTPINGPHVSKDEFGVHLYEVVSTISAIHTLRQMLNNAVHTGKTRAVAELTEQYKEAKSYLANQLPTLTDHEMAQVLERYPDVVTL